jgi:hypothetical protein
MEMTKQEFEKIRQEGQKKKTTAQVVTGDIVSEEGNKK